MAITTIPLVRGLPVVGSAFDMARDTRAFLTDSYMEHGPVFGMRLLNRRFTVLAGMEANRFLAREGTKHLRSFEFWRRLQRLVRRRALHAQRRRAGARGISPHVEAGLFPRVRRRAH